MPLYQYIDSAGRLKTIEASSPNEAISKAPGIAKTSGVSLASGAGTGATPQSGTRNLQLNSGAPASTMIQTGAASSEVERSASDPYTSFNAQLMNMLTRQQNMGTKRFAEQGFNAQQEQNNRILQKTDKSLIGANPNLQSSVRNASASAVNPTISQANRATQTFGEQINSFGGALDSAQSLLSQYRAQQDKERDDARSIIDQALQYYGSKAFDIVDPKYLKLAGYDPKTIDLAKNTIKEQELALKYGASGGTPSGTTGTTTTEQIGVLNDISNVLADPAFDQTFGVTNIVNRNNPGSPAYGVRTTMDQVINQLSLAARGQLKGQGQVSNYEGELLRKAQSAFTYYLSPEQARKELKQVAGAIRTSSGLTATVKITAPDGTSQTGEANQATISQAVADGNRVEYI